MSWTLENYDRLGVALAEHVMLVGIALGISLAIAFPLGICDGAPADPLRRRDGDNRHPLHDPRAGAVRADESRSWAWARSLRSWAWCSILC